MQTCHTCKEHGAFFCYGCNRIFCSNHGDEHRQSLDEQLDWLTVDHEDLIERSDYISLIEQTNFQSKRTIDRWEEESLRYIRQTADDARQALKNATETYVNTIQGRLQTLSEQFHAINNEMTLFDERNLQQLAMELHNLKQELQSTPPFTVRVHGNKPIVMEIIKIQPDVTDRNALKEEQEEKQEQQRRSSGMVSIQHLLNPSDLSSNPTKREKSLIPKENSIPLEDDRFALISDHVKILDHDQLILHDPTNIDASIRGLHDYSQGIHQLIFRIEHMTSNSWIFFGIISKQASLSHRAYLNPSAHGWTGYNNVFVNGKSQSVLNGYINDMKPNDLIELTLDCKNQMLIFWHSRQTYKIKLPIDIRSCPFPWQFLISCRNGRDCVRILPSCTSSTIKREQEKLTDEMKIKEMNILSNIESSTTVR